MGVIFTQYYTPSIYIRWCARRGSVTECWSHVSGRVRVWSEGARSSVMQFGASGDHESPHYFDQAELVSQRRLKPEYFEWADVLSHARSAYHPGDKPAALKTAAAR